MFPRLWDLIPKKLATHAYPLGGSDGGEAVERLRYPGQIAVPTPGGRMRLWRGSEGA